MPDQPNEGHESPKTGDNDTGGGDPFDDVDDLDTHVTSPVSGPTFYRADHDEDGADRPSGNSTVATRLAGEKHSNNPFESTHVSMARYAEAARNNRMNNNNRYR